MTQTPADPDPRPATPVLPPAGPAWAGSLMGTSITASLLQLHGAHPAAEVFLVLAALLALAFIGGWIRWRTPRFEATVMPAWAMLAMGLLALGSATSGVLGTPLAWNLHLGALLVGGLLGLLACLIYLGVLLGGRGGSPTFSWGLPLVAPMVTSTTAMQLHGHLSLIDAAPTLRAVLPGLALLLFALSLVTALPVFLRVYLRYFTPGGHRLHRMAAPTAWIPLGVIGQSSASAQLLAAGFGWHRIGVVYAAVMLCLGLPLGLLALWQHYRAVWHRLSYSPTWWSSTFPVGTCCLGTHALGQATGLGWLEVVSTGLLALLLLHVGWAYLGFVGAVRKHRGGRSR